MDINHIDSELNVKMKEVFKGVLKKHNVKISFDEIKEKLDIVESFSVLQDNHFFNLQKIRYKLSNNKFNDKYYPFLSKKIKNIISNLSNDNKMNVISKNAWYLFILKPFYGNIILNNNKYHFIYQMTYNSITIDLTKVEYERFLYYTKYVYKLQQLSKLNKELNIEQNFKIVFDDDKAAQEMYENLYNNFSDIIKPFNIKNDDIEDDMDDLDD